MTQPRQLPLEFDADGVPRTVNRRVKVRMIAQKYVDGGESIDAIADHYGITVADVHAALAYYYDNLAHFAQRDAEIQPILDEAKRYTEALNARIRRRMGGSE